MCTQYNGHSIFLKIYSCSTWMTTLMCIYTPTFSCRKCIMCISSGYNDCVLNVYVYINGGHVYRKILAKPISSKSWVYVCILWHTRSVILARNGVILYNCIQKQKFSTYKSIINVPEHTLVKIRQIFKCHFKNIYYNVSIFCCLIGIQAMGWSTGIWPLDGNWKAAELLWCLIYEVLLFDH